MLNYLKLSNFFYPSHGLINCIFFRSLQLVFNILHPHCFISRWHCFVLSVTGCTYEDKANGWLTQSRPEPGIIGDFNFLYLILIAVQERRKIPQGHANSCKVENNLNSRWSKNKRIRKDESRKAGNERTSFTNLRQNTEKKEKLRLLQTEEDHR